MNPRPEAPPQTGQVLVGPDGFVTSADLVSRRLLGLPDSAEPASVGEVLRACSLMPGSEADPVAFAGSTSAELRLEAAWFRDAAGGWAIAVRQSDSAATNLEEARLFVTNFSHELRTPLTTLKTALKLIQREAESLPERHRELLVASRHGVDRLIALVANLVDWNSLIAGQLELDLGETEPAELVRTAVEEMARRTGRTDLVASDSGAAGGLSADRRRVLRVLEALLENAVKWSEPGSGVEAEARRDGDEMVFSVSDRGPGVPEDARDRIFEAFRQADGSMTRAAGGLGLGLAICKRVIEQHGGRVKVEDRPGGGAVFSFSLPVNPPMQAME